MSLFDTGVRPIIDQHLLDEAAKVRDYGDYWSASSAGYCMRRNIFERLKVPHVKEDARKQRVFSSGHIFHSWIQELTRKAGVSIAQEVELQDEDLMVRGHFDDLVLINDNLILIDYKTQNSKGFATYAKKPSYYHKMQLGTYMYMLRNMDKNVEKSKSGLFFSNHIVGDSFTTADLTEARILKISKDDLRLAEVQYMWSEELSSEVRDYWTTLNKYWAEKKLPPCTCADREGGFLAKEAYNPFYFQNSPCSIEWYEKCKKEGLLDGKS